MNKAQYRDDRIRDALIDSIKKVIEENPKCQKVIDKGNETVETMQRFAKEYDIKIIANQYYSMTAKTRRILKVNFEDALSFALYDLTMRRF